MSLESRRHHQVSTTDAAGGSASAARARRSAVDGVELSSSEVGGVAEVLCTLPLPQMCAASDVGCLRGQATEVARVLGRRQGVARSSLMRPSSWALSGAQRTVHVVADVLRSVGNFWNLFRPL